MAARNSAFAPSPIEVPRTLVRAFRLLGVQPVLVGGSAVQVWTGRRDGLFLTHDLDFVGPLRAADLAKAGLHLERGGRHALVEGIAVEFPSGPLAVGDRILDPDRDSVPVPTRSGDAIRCLRPEACVLDRLAWVAGDRLPAAYVQALAVASVQSTQPGWNRAWIRKAASEARLGRLWKHLDEELRSGAPRPEALAAVLRLGWD